MKSIRNTPFFRLKKRLLIGGFFIRFFLIGAEYSIILPTALVYLQSLNADNVFMGIAVGIYPVGAMISLPLFGYLYDKTKRTKELLLVLNMFEIVGNILYSINISKWLPVTGRFIAGLGDGFLALTVGEITFLYPPESRIAILSFMELGRVLGLILGPLINFFIAETSYKVNGWILDNRTLPGVIMAISWILMEIITFFCVFNLAKEISEQEQGEEEPEMPLLTEEYLPLKRDRLYEDSIDSMPLYSSDSSLSSYEEDVSAKQEDRKAHVEKNYVENEIGNEKMTFWKAIKYLLAFELVIIFFVDLILWYAQTVFEIFLPYITEFDYKWSPYATGFVYSVGGVVVILMFFMMMATSGKIKDTYLLLFALIITQISLGLLIFESSIDKIQNRYIVFICICVLVFVTIPLNLACSKSLISKLTPQESQGTIQGVYSSISRIALVLGPVFGSIVFEKRVVYGAIMSTLCFFITIGFMLSLRRMDKRKKWIEKNAPSF